MQQGTLNDVLEELVEVAEGGFGDGLLRVGDPVERQVTVHGGDEREGARRADEPVTMGEQAEVFAGIAVGEGHAMAAEALFVEIGRAHV